MVDIRKYTTNQKLSQKISMVNRISLYCLYPHGHAMSTAYTNLQLPEAKTKTVTVNTNHIKVL